MDTEQAYLDLVTALEDYNGARAELETLVYTTESLESMYRHMSDYGVVSFEQRMALTSSLESLASQNYLNVSDIVPNIDNEDGEVSLESLKDALEAMWKKIVSAVLAVLEFFKRLWGRFLTYRGQTRLMAQMLLKKATARRASTSSESTIDMGVSARVFIQGLNVLPDADSISRAMSATFDQYETFAMQWLKSNLSLGKDFERVLKSGSVGSDIHSQVIDIFDELAVGTLAHKLNARENKDPRFGRRLVKMGPPTLAGRSLFFISLEPAIMDKRHSSPLDYASALRTTGVRYTHTNPNSTNVTGASIRAASGIQVQTLARGVLHGLDVLDKVDNSGLIRAIDSQTKSILSAADRYRKRVAGSETGYDESALRFARNYGLWAFGPIDSMTTVCMQIMRSTLSYGKKSLS